ncbi:unnamed protein product [Rhizoctonia solani]|uniref:Uncharacterized protein n=1 Tax=Rhizoctonia solani TaxID=456999 RepID=A0A8H3AEJ6_9AGAM|nr:unnamed protein product [Rhizoctonia solani]
MKYQTIIPLLLLPQLAPAFGAAVPSKDGSPVGLEKRNIKDGIRDKLKHIGDQKAKVLKVAAQGVKVVDKGAKAVGKGAKFAGNGVKVVGGKGIKAIGKGVKVVGQEIKKVEGEIQKTFTLEPELEVNWEELGRILPACAKVDCKNDFFVNEGLRWVKQAIRDVGVVVHENPAATAALVIGISILLAELISGGMLVPVALQAVGFGVKGPVRNTIAAAVQRVIHPIKLGSVFSKFQSAAMRGAALSVGIAGLVNAGVKPHMSIGHQEWRDWVSESALSAVEANMTQLWGTPTYGGCVAYGYREVRALLSAIPEDMDPLAACKRIPADIEVIGFKTPLRCTAEDSGKGVIGFWYVPTNATQCMPEWSTFEDEECMLYGQRRKFARLMGLTNGDDWRGVCESTSAIIGGKYYVRPSHCDDKGIAGIYGVFDIVDQQCECSCVST